MKLKAKINNVIYPIASGAIFSDELSEKLSSATIKIPHVDNFDLRPYEDIYIYEGVFNGFANETQTKFFDVESEHNIQYVNDGTFNYTDPRVFVVGIFFEIEEIGAWRNFYQNYTPINENTAPRVFNKLNIEVWLKASSSAPAFKIIFTAQGKHSESNEIVFENATWGTIKGFFTGQNDASTIEISSLGQNITAGYLLSGITMDQVDLNVYERKKRVDAYYFFINKKILEDYGKNIIRKTAIITINGVEQNGELTINYDTVQISFLLGTQTISIDFWNEDEDYHSLYGELYFENISYVIESIRVNYDLKNEPTLMPGFYKHFIVDNYLKEQVDLSSGKMNITINVFSETKYLEKIPLPNITLTQPINQSKRKSVWDYLNLYLNQYSPKRNYVTDPTIKTYRAMPKYSLDPALENIYKNVFAPDFQLNNPNLKDLLTQLMITKDNIPYVENNVIKAKSLSKTNGIFNDADVNFVTETMSSESYASNLKRSYTNALSERMATRFIEKTGFRNSSTSLLTLENLKLETRFPIYKIDKVLMCYYKRVFVQYGGGTAKYTKMILCKQDITKLVKVNSERNLLSKNWRDLNVNPTTMPSNIDELAEYKFATVGYDVGSKEITGWSEKYTFTFVAWFDVQKTYIENIAYFLDKLSPLGINTYGYIKENSAENTIVSAPDRFNESFINPFSNDSLAFKGLFFEIQYQGFYNGTLVHAKDGAFDDITANDNPSSSLTLLESDGLYEKEKINRLGNKVFILNARHYGFNQVQKIGSVWKDNIIIYQSEYSVFDDYIMTTYTATENYILKNYYTSVYSKHRPTSLATFDESIIRADNKKMFLLLSKNKVYFEKEQNIPFNKFLNNSTLLSAVFPSPLVESVGNFKTPSRINAGFFVFNNKNYLSDVNVFVSGYSLGLNVAMFDNVSSGVYIKDKELSIQNNAIGSEQDWYLMTDDIETGEIENLGIYVCHIDQSIYFDERVQDLDIESVMSIYDNVLFKMPLIQNVDNFITNVIGGEYLVNKDNKEILDFTFQIEPIALNNDIIFSSLLFKLSDVVGNFNKVEQTYTVRDSNNPAAVANTYASTYQEVLFQIDTFISNGIIQIDIPESVFTSIQPNSLINVQKFTYYKYKSSTVSWYFQILTLVAKTEDYLEFRCFFRDELNRKQSVENYKFYRAGFKETPSETNYMYPFRNRENTPGYKSFGISLNQVWKAITIFSPNPSYDNGFSMDNLLVPLTAGNSLQSYINFLDAQESIERTYFKNMYILKSPKKVERELVYNDLKLDYLGDLEIIDGQFSVDSNNEIPHIIFESNEIDQDTQSIHYYFLDDDNLKLVLAFNLNESERNDKKAIIYHSLVNSQDNRVYDQLNNLIGERKNMIGDNENYGKNNFYVII